MQKLTKEQSIIISAYTGFTACNFGDLHEAVEKKLGFCSNQLLNSQQQHVEQLLAMLYLH